MQRLAHMHQVAGIESSIVALRFSAEASANHIPQQLLRMKRQLDEYWLLESEQGRHVLAVLMPMGNNSAAEGYLDRIEKWLNAKPEQSLVDYGIHPHVIPLGKKTSLELLQRIDGMLND